MALISRVELDAQTLNRIPPGTDVQALLESVSSAIRERCGWHIAPARTETIVLDGSGDTRLALPTLHLLGITTASYRPRGRGPAVEVDVDDLEWSRAGIVRAPFVWPDRLGGVTLTIHHGHDPVPHALRALAARIVARTTRFPLGPVRETAGPLSIEPIGDSLGGAQLLQDEADALTPWMLGRQP